MRGGRVRARAAGRRASHGLRVAAIAVATILIASGVTGCGTTSGGAKSGGAAKAPADSMALLRQDVDRLRGELVELRILVETVERSGREHADRAASETRSEMDAIQKAMEALARHDLQRQVEVLDAQARRIDVLDKRAADQGQALRRVEMVLTGMESQLARILENSPASPSGRGGRPSGQRSAPAPGPTENSAGGGASAPSPAPAGAAGADLTPPAMFGQARNPRSPTPTAPGREATVEPTAPRPPGPAPPPEDASRAMKTPETAREPKAATPARPAADEAARTTAKAATPERPPPTSPAARDSKPRPTTPAPATGSGTARELFAHATQSWDKGERGQAVLDFEELVQRFPDDPLVATAQFRIGEAYYAARDFERAAQGYRKAVELDPTGKDTPRALLRLGLAYRAQKREADARQAWSRLVRDFPESDATEEARRALRGR